MQCYSRKIVTTYKTKPLELVWTAGSMPPEDQLEFQPPTSSWKHPTIDFSQLHQSISQLFRNTCQNQIHFVSEQQIFELKFNKEEEETMMFFFYLIGETNNTTKTTCKQEMRNENTDRKFLPSILSPHFLFYPLLWGSNRFPTDQVTPPTTTTTIASPPPPLSLHVLLPPLRGE